MRFATDTSLGRLGRLLRAAGLDTLCEHQCRSSDFWREIETDRVIVTRTHAVARRHPHRRLVFVRSNDPWQQLIQLVRETGLVAEDVAPFSRCLSCNTLIEKIDREAVRRRVPAYVWHCHQHFHTCRACQRIYWAGSHHERNCRRFDVILQPKDAH